jgi:S1-C subfamily serine protease
LHRYLRSDVPDLGLELFEPSRRNRQNLLHCAAQRDGYAVTNNHVVEQAKTVQIVTDHGKILNAKVIGTDPKADLALIKVDGNNFPFVKFADRDPGIGEADIADSLGLKKAEGALVSGPQSDSPAAKAGIMSRDVIITLDGSPVKDSRMLAHTIGSMAAGSSVKLGILRNGSEKTLTLTLGTLLDER